MMAAATDPLLAYVAGSTSPRPFYRTVECPTERGVAIIEATADRTSVGGGFLWLFGDFTKPPLELAVQHDDAVYRVSFTLQEESPDAASPQGRAILAGVRETRQGTPVLDTTAWARTGDVTVEHRDAVDSWWHGSNLCVRLRGTPAPTVTYEPDPLLSFLVCDVGCLGGIIFKNLNTEERRLIEQAALV